MMSIILIGVEILAMKLCDQETGYRWNTLHTSHRNEFRNRAFKIFKEAQKYWNELT